MKKIVLVCTLCLISMLSIAQDDNGQRPPMPPMDKNGKMMPPPGGFGGDHKGMPKDFNRNGKNASIGSKSNTGYVLCKGEKVVEGMTYTSTKADENAVQITGGTLTMNDCTIKKISGDTKDNDGSSFFGINSALYVGGMKSVVNMNGGKITTDAMGSNAAFAGNGATLNIENVCISCTKNLSRGIHATGNGTINAKNLHIETAGNNSSVIATDRGGGTVNVVGGDYSASGKDCAVLYSTGNISIKNATGCSEQGEVGVIEGDNSIEIDDCNMTSNSSQRGLMILQSGSGDANGMNGKIDVNGGTITMTDSVAPLCEVPTNISGTLTLKDVKLNVPSNVLMLVDFNKRWTTSGGTGNLILTTDSTAEYAGTVKADQYGKVNVTVKKGVTWSVTADTDINKLSIDDGATILLNGHKLIYKTIDNNGTIR
jgi:hypothetical protein